MCINVNDHLLHPIIVSNYVNSVSSQRTKVVLFFYKQLYGTVNILCRNGILNIKWSSGVISSLASLKRLTYEPDNN